MKTTHSIWNLLDGSGPLSPIKTSFAQKCMLIEISQDSDDGCYPRVCDWTRHANRLDVDGASYWVNRQTRNKSKLKIPFYDGVTILRDSPFSTDAVLEFSEPVEVVLGTIGDRMIVEKVKKIRGQFYHDWFWTRNGRQEKIANGYEIWFEIEEYLD